MITVASLILQLAYPGSSLTLIWFACDDSDFRPVQGQLVYFRDNSSHSENATAIISRKWEKVENEVRTIFDANNSTNTSTTLNTATTTIILTVRDNTPPDETWEEEGRTDSEEKEIAVDFPLPIYREVPPIIPIIWLRKIFAAVVDFINLNFIL